MRGMSRRQLVPALVSVVCGGVLVTGLLYIEMDPTVNNVCTLSSADRAATDSFKCLSCHDGTVAKSVVGSDPHGEQHPVEIDYAPRAAQGYGRLVPRPPPALVLTNGKVTCMTCHDGSSSEPHHTAMSMSGSAMCLACHAY